MEDVLKLYEKPLAEREPVVCVDEKPVVLHEDTRPAIPMLPRQIARRDYVMNTNAAEQPTSSAGSSPKRGFISPR